MYHMLQYVSVRAVHRHIDKMYQYVCILQDVYYKLCMLVVIEYMYIHMYIYIHYIIYIYIYIVAYFMYVYTIQDGRICAMHCMHLQTRSSDNSAHVCV